MLFSVAVRAKPAFAQGYGGQARRDGLGAGKRYLQMQSDIERVLFDTPAIHKRLDEMAAQITADYSDGELTVIAILTGSLMFMSDLLRRIPLPLKLDCLSVVSYHGKMQTSGEVISNSWPFPM
jgi:hypoxanthine-guanine phosphoribosyltransferase